jgi:hypothetical protein
LVPNKAVGQRPSIADCAGTIRVRHEAAFAAELKP